MCRKCLELIGNISSYDQDKTFFITAYKYANHVTKGNNCYRIFMHPRLGAVHLACTTAPDF